MVNPRLDIFPDYSQTWKGSRRFHVMAKTKVFVGAVNSSALENIDIEPSREVFCDT
jgi:hypothetical protein